VNRFIDHLNVINTNKCNTIADFHTKSSQSTFTSLYLVTALNNGYSFAVFPLDFSGNESWQWRFFSFRCPLAITPPLHPKLHCIHSPNWTRSVESYSLGVDPQRTPPATPLLLLCDVTAYMLTQSLHSNGCMRHVLWHLLYCCMWALPSNGCFSASTVLALSNYAIIPI
jgi:hypothetical protein